MRQSSQQYSTQDAYAGIQPQWGQVLDAAQHAHSPVTDWESRQFGFAADTNMDYPDNGNPNDMDYPDIDIERFADDGNPNDMDGE